MAAVYAHLYNTPLIGLVPANKQMSGCQIVSIFFHYISKIPGTYEIAGAGYVLIY